MYGFFVSFLLSPAALMAFLSTLAAFVLGLLVGVPMARAFQRGLREVGRLDCQTVPSDAYWMIFRRGALSGRWWRFHLLWIMWPPTAAWIMALFHEVHLGQAPIGTWLPLMLYPVAIALWHAVACIRFAPTIARSRWNGAFPIALANMLWVALAILIVELAVRRIHPGFGFLEVGEAMMPSSSRINAPTRHVTFRADFLPFVHLVLATVAFAVATDGARAKGPSWFRLNGEAAA